MRLTGSKQKNIYHFKLTQYNDMDKTEIKYQNYFIGRNDLAEYLEVNPQQITDYFKGKTATQKRPYNKMCYVNIEKNKYIKSDLQQQGLLMN